MDDNSNNKSTCEKCPLYDHSNSDTHPLQEEVHALSTSLKKIKQEMYTFDTKLFQLYYISIVGVALGCIKIYMEMVQ